MNTLRYIRINSDHWKQCGCIAWRRSKKKKMLEDRINWVGVWIKRKWMCLWHKETFLAQRTTFTSMKLYFKCISLTISITMNSDNYTTKTAKIFAWIRKICFNNEFLHRIHRWTKAIPWKWKWNSFHFGKYFNYIVY